MNFKPLIAAIMVGVPLSPAAADSWNYCVLVDENGTRARFTNVFQLPFSLKERHERRILPDLEYEIGATRDAAGGCLTFNSSFAAVERRTMSITSSQRSGLMAYVVNYDIWYENGEFQYRSR